MDAAAISRLAKGTLRSDRGALQNDRSAKDTRCRLETELPLTTARLYQIDAAKHFGVAVDACFFVLTVGTAGAKECMIFPSLNANVPVSIMGYRNGVVATDIHLFDRWSHLLAECPEPHIWRSGIKHDCSSVMEIHFNGTWHSNSRDERVDIEDMFVYPLLKSSDIANGRTAISRSMIIPQRRVGEDTARIEKIAPLTWQYLLRHGEQLDGRRSSIYNKKGRFAIFGVGG